MEAITNKKAYFDYEILEKFEAGISLLGHEVKSIKNGRINLTGSYVIIRGKEVWLLNADIPTYQPKNLKENYDPLRTRKLLLNLKEILYLSRQIDEKGLTLIPLKVYTKSQRIKLEIGLAKSRKKHDKRELLKERDDRRQMRKFAV